MSTNTTDTDKPYTYLWKEDAAKRASLEVDIPEYLEIYDSTGDAVYHRVNDETEYSTLGEHNDQVSLPQVVNENEYYYATVPQFAENHNTNNAGNQYLKHKQDDTEQTKDTSEMESAYYSIPPDAP